jgi:hypothetical protein
MTTARAGFFERERPHRDPYSPLTPAQRSSLTMARRVARLMDARFGVPGLRFGLDTIVGIVPVAGYVITTGASLYLLLVARHLNLPKRALLRMALNIGADFLVGLVPVAGDAADLFFKANMRNLRIIEDHVRRVENVYEGTARHR